MSSSADPIQKSSLGSDPDAPLDPHPAFVFCGTRLDVPDTVSGSICNGGERRGTEKRGEWGKWDGSEDEVGATQSARCIGVELEEIPMCSVCEVETAGESPGRVLERGLETVTKSDKGLSRNRLDMLSETKDRTNSDLWVSPRSSAKEHRREATKAKEGLRSFSHCRSKCHMSELPNVEDMTSLLENAAAMGISEDGSMDDCHSHSDTEMCDLGRGKTSTNQDAAVVYVSVLDPIGEPAFRPSKTKPLPKWMNLLPRNVHREHERRSKTAAKVTEHSHEMEQMRETTGSYPSDGSDDSDIDTPVPGSRSITPTSNIEEQTAPSTIDNPQKLQKRATVAFEPIYKGNTTEDAACESNRCSQTADSTCLTAEKHPCSHPSRPQTPYPRSPYPSRPSIARKETTSYFSHRPSIAKVDSSEPCLFSASLTESSDPSRVMSPVGDFTNTPEPLFDLSSPPQSSEYLERYLPKKAPEANFEKYVASEAEPIREKIKRQKAGIKDGISSSKEMIDEVKGKRTRKSPLLVDEEFGLDPRREDLNKELRNLFCEE
ncbi:hypothetical protein ACEPPN_004625 [Leptodophora sp. 'Broadleaf-Isolate-01']